MQINNSIYLKIPFFVYVIVFSLTLNIAINVVYCMPADAFIPEITQISHVSSTTVETNTVVVETNSTSVTPVETNTTPVETTSVDSTPVETNVSAPVETNVTAPVEVIKSADNVVLGEPIKVDTSVQPIVETTNDTIVDQPRPTEPITVTQNPIVTESTQNPITSYFKGIYDAVCPCLNGSSDTVSEYEMGYADGYNSGAHQDTLQGPATALAPETLEGPVTEQAFVTPEEPATALAPETLEGPVTEQVPVTASTVASFPSDLTADSPRHARFAVESADRMFAAKMAGVSEQEEVTVVEQNRALYNQTFGTSIEVTNPADIDIVRILNERAENPRR